MLSGIPRCNGVIQTLLLFDTHPFRIHHVAAGLHGFHFRRRDYDKEHSGRKHPLMLLPRTLGMYDAGVDVSAHPVECIVGWQRGRFSEKAGRRAHLCGGEYHRCQSFLVGFVRATLYWRV